LAESWPVPHEKKIDKKPKKSKKPHQKVKKLKVKIKKLKPLPTRE